MKACSKCLTLVSTQQLYCPSCKTILASSDTAKQDQTIVFKSGRLRTQPSKVYTGYSKELLTYSLA